MNFILLFSFASLVQFFNPEWSINKALTEDQKIFVSENAPIFIAPDCKSSPNIDAFCELNFDGDWLAGNNLDNLSKASKGKPTIYYDWYETTGFIVLSYMQYRVKNEIPGVTFGIGNHAHDTESVVKIFKKRSKLEDSALIGTAETQPELVAVLANIHGLFVSAAPLAEHVNQLDRDFTSLAFTGRGMSDDLMKLITHNASKPEDRVFDYEVGTGRPAFIYSKSLNHSLVPVMKLAVAEENLDKNSTRVLRHSSQPQTERFSRAEHSTYELVELASIITDPTPIVSANASENGKTKAECLLVGDAALPAAKHSAFNGVEVCVDRSIGRDIQKNLKGEGDQPMAYNHQIPNYRKTAGARSFKEVREHRIPIVNTPKFLLEGFNGLATKDEVQLIRNPYMIPVKE